MLVLGEGQQNHSITKKGKQQTWTINLALQQQIRYIWQFGSSSLARTDQNNPLKQNCPEWYALKKKNKTKFQTFSVDPWL